MGVEVLWSTVPGLKLIFAACFRWDPGFSTDEDAETCATVEVCPQVAF